MLTIEATYGITCDVCETRLDLATRGIAPDTDKVTVRRLARKMDWQTFSRADRDICRSCATSPVGQRTISAFADEADDDSEGADAGTTGPRIAPSDDPGGEPATVVPSGEPVPDGTEEERQNSDEPYPGEPREVPSGGEDEPEESQRDFARLEGAGAR